MTESKVREPALPQPEQIQDLLRSNGVRITVLLPPYRPGEQSKSMADILKTYLKDLLRQLEARRLPNPVIFELLKPLHDLIEDEEFSAGSHFGRVIFRSRELFQQFELLEMRKAECIVGSYFQIRPMLTDLHFPKEFYLLKLSKKDVQLNRCANLRMEVVKLPKGVPETLEEALEFKQPDHDLENRSAAGASPRSMRGIRFGTGSGRETQPAYLADFYRLVDRGIAELVPGDATPLVLAGVDEDTAMYRTIHTYRNLLSQSIHGSPTGSFSEQDLLGQVYAIVRTEQVERLASFCAESRERLAPARFSIHLETILSAAQEGRVDKLFIDEAGQRTGFLPGARSTNEPEDLLNVAAVETILHGGTTYALPSNKMPDGAAVAAVFRY
jgi:hypothetical protein